MCLRAGVCLAVGQWKFPVSAKVACAAVVYFNEQRYLLSPLLKAACLKVRFNSFEVLLGRNSVRSLQTSRITGAILNLLEILSDERKVA